MGSNPTPPTKYGDCSSVGRVEDCGSFGHGFDPHHSPEIKYAVVAQLVEHVFEEHGVGCSIHSHRTNVQMAKLENALVCKTNIRQFESDSGLKIRPCGENG